jgi:hypothetical protein
MTRARMLVESGDAEWLVLKKDPVEVEHICPICAGDDLLKKSCQRCKKTGKIVLIHYSLVRTNDIVRVTQGSGEDGCEVFRSVLAKQTPRVATIELAHIFRAYVNGYIEDQQRINEYGKMGAEFLKSLIVPFKPDPFEGRVLFPFGADERSFPRVTRR